MKLKDILNISGQPGLYKFIAQSGNGIIVESLADGKRMNVSSASKVSSLGEIAVYTDDEDKPLSDIFTEIFSKTEGKPSIDPKSQPEILKKQFAEYVQDYDRDRVHVSDIKKIFSWYNILVGAGMTDFSEEEEETEEKSPANGE